MDSNRRRRVSFLSVLLPECHKSSLPSRRCRLDSRHIYQECGLWKAMKWRGRGLAWAGSQTHPHKKRANRMAAQNLLAEDDTRKRGFLVKALQAAGHNLNCVSNGAAGYPL